MSRLWLVLVLVLAACVPPDGSQPQYATGDPQQQQQQPQATGLNCTQLFSCFAGCNADGACVQGCQAQADPSAQASASALMQCGASRCQNEGTCVARECRAEIDACGANQVAQQAPPPPVQEATPASTPGASQEMHASDLVKEFEVNEVRAHQVYVGSRVRIHGTVNAIEVTKDGRLRLTFKSSISTYNNARCYFGQDQASRVATLSANETATVEGTVRGWEDGFGGAKVFVLLEECVVP